MVIMYREKKIVLPRFIASPILLGTSVVTRFKNKSTRGASRKSEREAVGGASRTLSA